MNQIVFRPASVVDIPEMLNNHQFIHAESKIPLPALNIDAAAEYVLRLIEGGDFVYVADDGTRLVGFILAHTDRPWYSDELHVIEDLLYVHPDHRGGRLAMKLIGGLIAWAQSIGAAKVCTGVSTGNEAAARLYQKFGFGLSVVCFQRSP